ncbi:MAG: O-antigen ligase family protein [Hyphomicrobium sp.]
MMAHALTVPARPAYRAASPKAGTKSTVHRAALSLVWLTVASSSIVFSEPAAVDLLTFGLFVLLPVAGLFDAKPMAAALFAVLLAISALSFLAATFALNLPVALTHAGVSLYLYGAAFLFAGFVAKRPLPHARLILNAYLAAAIIAASLGIAGYLDLFPGAYDLFTRYDRASGPFKDPNVFGPFLIPALLTALHIWLTQPLSRGVLPLVLAGVLSAGILLSFSRGAWAGAAIAFAIYAYFYSLGANRNLERFKLALLVIAGTAAIALIVAVALQSENVNRLLSERAALTQPYDEGPEGRFGGQLKAIATILDNPLGIGGLQFAPFIHHEEPHNVYLNMTMSTGWAGGLLYMALCAAILAAGFRHALKKTRSRGLFLIVYGSLAATILQGLLIDSDHWRHFYLLLGLATGLMAGDSREVRTARIVADRRPVLRKKVLLIPPARRQGRIVARLPQRMTLGYPVNPLQLPPDRRRSPRRRHPRILTAM